MPDLIPASWRDNLDFLEQAAALHELSWLPDDPQIAGEVRRQLLMNLALGYFVYFQADEDCPDLSPFLNSVFLLQPNPDDTYYFAAIDGRGRYRLSGDRGTVKLLTLTIGDRMIGMTETPGPQLAEYDLDQLGLQHGGPIDILLSEERPQGHAGAWLALDPRASFLMIRQRSYDWGGEVSARIAIERLDGNPCRQRYSLSENDRRIHDVIAFAERLTRQWLGYVRQLREKQPPNEMSLTGFSEFGGVQVQAYWQAIFDIAPDEALILETELPAVRPYWNVQLNDEIWNTLEFVWRQSSLNGGQARVDSDGRFRAVIAASDPGVPNWLDTVGRQLGTIVGRWYACDSQPVPTLKKVKLHELRDHLPGDTPRVTPEERAVTIRARAVSAQLRRRW
jgi:hypothetical protein